VVAAPGTLASGISPLDPPDAITRAAAASQPPLVVRLSVVRGDLFARRHEAAPTTSRGSRERWLRPVRHPGALAFAWSL